jgi:hypothetical protein
MDKEEIKKLILEQGLTVTDVIDVVVELNGFVGVGLITLGDNFRDYCHNKIPKRNWEGS